ATVLARYEGAYAAAGLVVMGDRSGFAWKDVPEYNYIDKLVYEKLRQVKVLPSDVCTDGDFIRRIYLDLTGLPPEPQQVRAYLAISLNCNTGHDHPFERWTQNQYYETSAYFAQVSRAEDPRFKGQRVGGTDVEGAKPLVEVIADVKGGDVTHLRTGQVAPPK